MKIYNTIAPRDAQWREQLRKAMTTKERTAIPRCRMPELDPAYRVTCNEEVNQGISRGQAVLEATRCLDCPDPACVTGCPVQINIPGFIKNIQRGDILQAAAVLKETSALPAVCGRVCPQEKQCESKCIYHKMSKQPVAIGYLERFAADYDRDAGTPAPQPPRPNGHSVAVVGSGPAGLSFAGEMMKLGYKVTVLEALHEIGGVLKYGIPEFRLPNFIVEAEINSLRNLGVEFQTDVVVGKTITYDRLIADGYDGVFVASGAGLPRFMGVPGENLIGVMSSNEYLTRVNLMGAGRKGYATPVKKGKNVAVVGGGNTAMDSVRTALRMGAEHAYIIYRRSEKEMPARVEEVCHARQEGVEFLNLWTPIEFRGDSKGNVTTAVLQHMRLGEPDESGRRSPVPIEGDTMELPVDEVIISVGVSPNPLIPRSLEDDGLAVGRKGTIEVNDDMRSSIPMLYAGGDIVRGGATVILAMGDGRRAARAMAQAIEDR